MSSSPQKHHLHPHRYTLPCIHLKQGPGSRLHKLPKLSHIDLVFLSKFMVLGARYRSRRWTTTIIFLFWLCLPDDLSSLKTHSAPCSSHSWNNTGISEIPKVSNAHLSYEIERLSWKLWNKWNSVHSMELTTQAPGIKMLTGWMLSEHSKASKYALNQRISLYSKEIERKQGNIYAQVRTAT